MLYYIVRPFAREGLRLFYRRIDLIGRNRIPKNAAVILAANHPTAFIEPCILACFLPRPLYFLARGNLFQKSFYARLLRSLHIIPVFRMKDLGMRGLRQNFSAFERCYQALNERKTLMILAEGRCVHEKRLRPIQKGTARIALGALEQYADLEEVYIVPVGINYTYADRMRSHVMIRFAEPLKASAYFDAFRKDQREAVGQLTQDLESALRPHVVGVAENKDELLLDHLLQMDRSIAPRFESTGISEDETTLNRELAVAHSVAELDEESRNALFQQTASYFSRLHWLRLDPLAVAGQYERLRKHTTRFVLGVLPAALLIAWFAPLLAVAYWVAGTKVPPLRFYQPVKWGLLSGFLFLYLPFWLIVAWASETWWLLGLSILFLAGLHWLLSYLERLQRALLAWRMWRQPPETAAQLRREQAAIISAWRAKPTSFPTAGRSLG